MDYDDELIAEIAPHVLRALDTKMFFQKLDDQMCPEDPGVPRVLCQGSLAITTTALAGCGFVQEEIDDVVAVLKANGGFCDCEVLYNAATESRLKSEYWRAVAANRKPLHGHGSQKTGLRIWVLIEKDELGYPVSQDWEDLWGQPAGDGLVRVESVPFFATGIAKGDFVAVAPTDEGLLVVKSVAQRGGHSTFRIWLAEGDFSSSNQVVGELQKIGAAVEVTTERLLAIDAEPEHEADIWSYLEEGKTRGAWEVHVGYSPG